MPGDWVKLHRQTLDSQVFSDPELWHLFCWCLLKTNWKTGWFQGVEVPAGSFATGREAAGESLGMSGSAWYRNIKKLEAMGVIGVKANNRFTVISVLKWSFFQNGEQQVNNERTTNEQPTNNERTTSEQRVDTIEEGKKDKKERKEEAISLMDFPTKKSGTWKLTREIADELRQRFPKKDRKAEYQKALDWLESDPKHLKTATGMKRFLTGWLERSDDKQPVERMRTSKELIEETERAKEFRRQKYEAERLAKEGAK